MLIAVAIKVPTKAINKYSPNPCKSILVKYPIAPNIPKIKAVIKKTYIIELISKRTKILENVKPFTNEYNMKHILAVVGLILFTLAEKNITRTNSKINNIQYKLFWNIANSIFSFVDTTYPVKNVTIKPTHIHKNVFDNNLLILSSFYEHIIAYF